jgi:hypothetical protein
MRCKKNAMGVAQAERGASVPRGSESAPVAKELRRSIFLVDNGKWDEGGKVCTASAHRTVDVPLWVAEVALKLGHAVEPGSEEAVLLRAANGPDYAQQPADICIDITKSRAPERIKYFEGWGVKRT